MLPLELEEALELEEVPVLEEVPDEEVVELIVPVPPPVPDPPEPVVVPDELLVEPDGPAPPVPAVVVDVPPPQPCAIATVNAPDTPRESQDFMGTSVGRRPRRPQPGYQECKDHRYAIAGFGRDTPAGATLVPRSGEALDKTRPARCH
jgi:hypothetical protein